jgi:hypothetical protein
MAYSEQDGDYFINWVLVEYEYEQQGCCVEWHI